MSDVALTWNSERGAADFTVARGDLLADGGLEGAVLLSLFADRRVDGQRGWWGDSVAAVSGDEFGSRLWTLAREVDRPVILRNAEEYAREALAWMVEDQVAERVDVVAESLAHGGERVLALSVSVSRPEGTTSYRYAYNWDALTFRRM